MLANELGGEAASVLLAFGQPRISLRHLRGGPLNQGRFSGRFVFVTSQVAREKVNGNGATRVTALLLCISMSLKARCIARKPLRFPLPQYDKAARFVLGAQEGGSRVY